MFAFCPSCLSDVDVESAGHMMDGGSLLRCLSCLVEFPGLAQSNVARGAKAE